MKRWTHREYRTRLAWLDEQWNQPSRSDQYAMQIAFEIVRMHADPKKIKSLKMDDFKLKFTSTEAKPTPKLSMAEQAKQSISRWCGFVGLPRKRKE